MNTFQNQKCSAPNCLLASRKCGKSRSPNTLCTYLFCCKHNKTVHTKISIFKSESSFVFQTQEKVERFLQRAFKRTKYFLTKEAKIACQILVILFMITCVGKNFLNELLSSY